MKGVVVLLLTLSVFGNPITMTQFFAGYNEGVASPQTCIENPEMCGEFLGEFVGVLGAVLKEQNLEELVGASTKDVQLFISGLVAGLTLTNSSVSACVNDFTQSNYQFATLYNAILALLNNPQDYQTYVVFACSGASMVNLKFLDDCHFKNLWLNIQGMTIDKLLKIYAANSCDINTAVVGVTRCKNDYSWCGHSVGVLIREVFSWGI